MKTIKNETIMIVVLVIALISFMILSFTVLSNSIITLIFLVSVAISLIIAFVDLIYDIETTNEMIELTEKNLKRSEETIHQMKKEYDEIVKRDN